MTITLHAWHALVALLIVGLAWTRWAGDEREVAGMCGIVLALLALGALIGRAIP